MSSCAPRSAAHNAAAAKDDAEQILVDYVAGQYFVWSPRAVRRLRRAHRAVCGMWGGKLTRPSGGGSTTGCRLSGRVPGALLHEQAVLLRRLGVIAVRRLRRVLPSRADGDAHEAHVRRAVDAENERMRDEWLSEKRALARHIAKGRAAKRIKADELGDAPLRSAKERRVSRSEAADVSVTSEQVQSVLDEFARSAHLSAPTSDEHAVKLPLAIASGNVGDYADATAHANQADCAAGADADSLYRSRVRQAAVEHFWRCGYYITCGLQFGADFLLYPGDPVEYHASKVVVCGTQRDELSLSANGPLAVAAHVRVALNVKKTVVFAAFNAYDQLVLTTVKFDDLHYDEMAGECSDDDVGD